MLHNLFVFWSDIYAACRSLEHPVLIAPLYALCVWLLRIAFELVELLFRCSFWLTFNVQCVCFVPVQRKLLVEKRVVLDDIPHADRKSDRLLATLPPRSATIQRDDDSVSKLRSSKSEYNVSRTKSSSPMHSAGPQPSRARLATSISVGNSLSTNSCQPAAAGHVAHSDTFGSWKVHDINEVREPWNVNSVAEPGRVRSSEQTYVATSTLGRVNSAAASSSQRTRICATAGHLAGNGRTRTDRDQCKRVSTNTDSTQSVSHGARPRSVPPKLCHQPLQARDAQDSDSMGAQYEPGNVRHLVQTFQSAFRSATTSERGDGAGDQTYVHDGLRAADEPHQVSTSRDHLQPADRQYHRQSGGDKMQGQRWPPGQRNLSTLPPRPDANVNVCVVRPATGRTLPQPPSTPGAQELPNQLEQSDPRSSHKVNKLWQAYGCL